MPLEEGKSNAARSRNIATEIKAGKKPAQAAAIAYAKQRGDDCDLNTQILERWDEEPKEKQDAYVRIIDSVSSACDDIERRLDSITNKGKHFHAHTHIPRGTRIAGKVRLK